MARSRSPERREHLLAAALRVFGDRGVDRATIDEVTHEAGVAKGTFYLYFHSKNDLVGALRRQFVDDLADAMLAQSPASGPTDWLELARRQLETAADAYLTSGPLHEVLFHYGASEELDDADAQWVGRLVEALTGFVCAGTAAGAFTVTDPELAAVQIFHAIHGLFHHALHGSAAPDRRRLVTAGWELVSRTLTAAVSEQGASEQGASEQDTSGANSPPAGGAPSEDPPPSTIRHRRPREDPGP
jgi:AcrR family transcriptional regulator